MRGESAGSTGPQSTADGRSRSRPPRYVSWPKRYSSLNFEPGMRRSHREQQGLNGVNAVSVAGFVAVGPPDTPIAAIVASWRQEGAVEVKHDLLIQKLESALDEWACLLIRHVAATG